MRSAELGRRIRSAGLGTLLGALLSAAAYFLYIVVLHEPGSGFYAFAALVFLGCPLVAGISALALAPRYRPLGFLAGSSLVFGLTLLLFIATYVVLPEFDRANVQLPAACDGFHGVLDLPSRLKYALPDGQGGVLLAESAESVVAATIDGHQSPFASTAYLVRKRDNAVLARMPFPNDVVMAAIQTGTVYLYNDKLGYPLKERSGEHEDTILLIDNYGGLTETDRPIIGLTSSGHWYFETTAVVSIWHSDGTVQSRPHLQMNGIARGCYVSGLTGEVIPLGPRR
ncbi:MAG TPA: hypothetical protein VKY74_18080 [Chloroflexia bacterium]|nr:hypothetical protein [Chloroflexia bacterium]